MFWNKQNGNANQNTENGGKTGKKTWLHAPDALLNGHVAYLVKVSLSLQWGEFYKCLSMGFLGCQKDGGDSAWEWRALNSMKSDNLFCLKVLFTKKSYEIEIYIRSCFNVCLSLLNLADKKYHETLFFSNNRFSSPIRTHSSSIHWSNSTVSMLRLPSNHLSTLAMQTQHIPVWHCRPINQYGIFVQLLGPNRQPPPMNVCRTNKQTTF